MAAAPKFEYPADENYDEVSEVRDRGEIIKGPWKAHGEPMKDRARADLPKPKRMTADWVQAQIMGRPY